MDCIVGENVIIGRGADIGMDVKIWASNEIQNYAFIYELAKSEARVFIDPGVMPTNYENPRAIEPNDSQKDGGIGNWLAL
jgi:NDP-sugar pyrophosphorylase family protein